MKIQPVILFDGVCNLCNSSVNFVIKRDREKTIRFASLQSNAGQQLLDQFNISNKNIQSFIFIENGIPYQRSEAVLRVSRYLGSLWPVCYIFIIIPRFIRDRIYNYIALKRYDWFGRKDECMVPMAEIKNRFLY